MVSLAHSRCSRITYRDVTWTLLGLHQEIQYNLGNTRVMGNEALDIKARANRSQF